MVDDGTMSYFAKIGLDVSDFTGGLSKSSQGLLQFARDVTVTMNMTMQIFNQVVQSVQKFGQMANELRDLSYTTGVTTDQLQRMQYAAILSGTSFYTVSNSLQKLTLTMDEATKSRSEAAAAFARLGVDPTGKSVDQVFNETALALFQMKSETDRNSIAMDIYGRGWKDLIPYMQTYIEKKAEIAKAPMFSKAELNTLAEGKAGYDSLTESMTKFMGQSLAFFEKLYIDQAKRGRMIRGELDSTPAAGTGAGAGGREGSETLPAAAVAQDLTPLIDQYVGLTNAQIDLIVVSNDLTQAQADQAAALESSDKGAFDDASRRVQELKNRYDELTIATNDDEMRVSSLTSAYKEYENQIRKVIDQEKDLYNLDRDYAEDIMAAGRDVGSMRSITMNFVRQRRSITGNLDTDVQGVVSAATSYNAIKGGADLSTVKGTPQYQEAQAKKGLAGITITGPIYLNGDKSFETYLSSQLLRNGVSP